MFPVVVFRAWCELLVDGCGLVTASGQLLLELRVSYVDRYVAKSDGAVVVLRAFEGLAECHLSVGGGRLGRRVGVLEQGGRYGADKSRVHGVSVLLVVPEVAVSVGVVCDALVSFEFNESVLFVSFGEELEPVLLVNDVAGVSDDVCTWFKCGDVQFYYFPLGGPARGGFVELPAGLEPATYCLEGNCSFR